MDKISWNPGRTMDPSIVVWSRAIFGGPWSLACLVFSGSYLPSSWAEAEGIWKRTKRCRKTCEETMQFAVWFPEDSKQIKLDCRQTKPPVILLISVNQRVVYCLQQHQADTLALSIVKHHREAFIYESLHCEMMVSYLIKHPLVAWRCSNPNFPRPLLPSSHQQLAGSAPHRTPRVHWCFFSDICFGIHPSAVIFLSLGPGVVLLLLSKLGLGGRGTSHKQNRIWWQHPFELLLLGTLIILPESVESIHQTFLHEPHRIRQRNPACANYYSNFWETVLMSLPPEHM